MNDLWNKLSRVHAGWQGIAVAWLTLGVVAFFSTGVMAQTGSLSGHILRNSDGSPLANVQVYLMRGEDPNIADEDAWYWVSSTATNSTGLYSFAGLQERRYRVQFPGQEVSGTNYFEANLYNVQVLSGAETANMDLQVRQAGLIYGYVKTAGGIPIPNASVVVDAPWTEYGNSWSSVSTDWNGRYDFYVPPSPGQFYPVWVAQANMGGTDYASAWHGNLYKATLAGTQVPDYELVPGGTVTGRVVNESGVGIQGVWLEVEGSPEGVDGPWTETDADGYFWLRGVVPGINYISLDSGWREIQQDGVKYMMGETSTGPVNVSAGGTVDVGTFTIYRAGMITGVVTDEGGFPVVGAEVELEGRDINGNWADRDSVVTDAFGQYSVDYVAPGTYRVNCSKDGFVPAIESGVAVARGQHVERDLVLRGASSGAILWGKITNYTAIRPKDAEGVPLPLYYESNYEDFGYAEFGLLAMLMDPPWTAHDFLDPDARFLASRSDEEGIDDGYGDYFETAVSEVPGRYEDWFVASGDVALCIYHDEGEQAGDLWSVSLSDWKRLNLSNGDVRTNVDFTCAVPANPGILRGNLNVPAGYNSFPGDWAMIYAYRLDANGNVVNPMPMGDAVGGPGYTRTYELSGLAAGNYMLRAYARNLAGVVIDSVTVSAGQTTNRDITFTAGGTISGQVTDGAAPVAGATLEVVETGAGTITNASGNYSIPGLNAGSYTVQVSAPGYVDAQATVNVTEGSTTTQNFALSNTAGSIAGTVKDPNGANVNGATVVAYNETDRTNRSVQTVAGAFTIEPLTPGQYILAVDVDQYGVTVYPADPGRIALAPSQDVDGVAITVGSPVPPGFSVYSSVSDGTPSVLSMEFSSSRDLLAPPAVTIIEGAGTLGGLTSNAALNRFEIAYTANANDDLVRIRIQETTPLVAGNPGSRTFSFEVGSNLVTTSTTNVTNATGGTACIMGTQDNTQVYVPPFALAGVESSEAVPLTIARYGDPGDPVEGDPNQTVTAVYDFTLNAEGAQIDENHTFTVTMSFLLPSGMTHGEFESSLTIKYFDAGDQRWKTDGISNVRINWVNQTIMFEVSHLTQFAGFVGEQEHLLHDWNGDGIVSIIGDVPPFVNCVYFQNCPDWPEERLLAVGDCNHDGIISIVGDVPCFVDCVYFNNCPE